MKNFMKKLHSNGHSLIQNENTLSFVSFSEEEDKTYYYQYNGENLKEISKKRMWKVNLVINGMIYLVN